MIKVGLTGGIGSGKSTVASLFQELEIPIYNADLVAKEFLKTKDVQHALVDFFGKDIIRGNQVNKPRLASIIFNDKEALYKVNNLIHPLVRQGFRDWSEKFISQSYVMIEVAILFENGFDTLVDKSIVVTAPLEQRLTRTIKRDASNEEAVKSRMNNQWNQEKLISLADFVIDNADNRLLIPQVLEIDQKIKAGAIGKVKDKK